MQINDDGNDNNDDSYHLLNVNYVPKHLWERYCYFLYFNIMWMKKWG